MTSTLICPDCGKFVMRTDLDALICPDGHGKVLGVMNAIDYGVAARRHRLATWLAAMPTATKQKKGFEIVGIAGVFKRAAVMRKGDKTTSRLKVGERAPDGLVAAKVGERAFVFTRIEKRASA